jgi:hypothetical protein
MAKSVAEIDSFITMLCVACEDKKINSVLEGLLSQPDERRRGLVHEWVSDLLLRQAPKEFIEAIACLSDDAIAEKAYEVIYQCRRAR